MNSQPWTSEGDAFDWIDEATGLRCAMRRNNFSSWCGYVAMEPGAPLFGLDYDSLVKIPAGDVERFGGPIDQVGVMNLFLLGEQIDRQGGVYPLCVLARCHGGLTFADRAWWAENDPGHWFGFDCSHAGDRSPGLGRPMRDDVYRTAEFVRLIVGQLAEDLAWLQIHAVPVTEEA